VAPLLSMLCTAIIALSCHMSSYAVCGQFDGSLALSAVSTVFCSPSSDEFRFVIIHGAYATPEALCIAEVYVFAASK